MKAHIEKLKEHFEENQPVFLLFAAILILSLAFGVYSQINLRNQIAKERASFENELASKDQDLEDLNDDLKLVLEENKSLSDLLSDEQTRVYELEREKRKSEEEIEELTKLTTIDPELLKKYSKVYFLSDHYVPRELEEVDEKYIFNKDRTFEVLADIVPFLEDMLDEAEEDEVIIRIGSAYRSFATQKALKDRNVVVYGAGTANSFSAEQGYSEHQLGTTLDFTTPSLGGALTGFQNTEAYKWLLDNAYKYGFVLSYPPNNKYYIYEPWHWRFVGRELARDLHDEEKFFYELDQREIDEYLIDIFE